MSSTGTLWTVACQAFLSMGFSRQEYWKGLPSPPPGDLGNPGIEPVTLTSPMLADGFFTTRATCKACLLLSVALNFSCVLIAGDSFKIRPPNSVALLTLRGRVCVPSPWIWVFVWLPWPVRYSRSDIVWLCFSCWNTYTDDPLILIFRHYSGVEVIQIR